MRPGGWWLLEGWLGLGKRGPDGRRMLVDLVLAGSWVEPSGPSGETAAFEIQALTDAVVAPENAASLRRRLEHAPALARALEADAAGAGIRRTERILRTGRGSGRARIAFVLLELLVRTLGSARAREPGDARVPLPLTQEELGDLTGLSSVHVCRTLGRLAGGGRITIGDGEVRIRDLEGLEQDAGIAAATLARRIVPA